MKTAIMALLLCYAAAAFAQIPAEKPVIENYTYNAAPRFITGKVKKTDYTYEPSYRNIRPPLEEVKVAKANDNINSADGGKLSYASGTTLTIPPGAFVDENGNEIAGNVTVGFREYKNPLDFLLGGIPMSYDSSNNKNMFLSAGMFELTASVNGKQVFLKQGSKIDVQMSSVDAQPDYNLYAFNDATGKWEMKADKKEIKVKSSSDYFYSPAIAKYMSALTNDMTIGYDSTSFSDRFESMNYYYTRRSNEKEIGQNRWWWGGKNYRTLVKVSNVHKSKDGEITFRLARTVGTNRELAPYQFVSWQVKDKMDFSEFKKLIANSKNYFFDIRIKQGDDEYIMRLKGISGIKEIKVVPARVNDIKEIAAYSEKEKIKMYGRYCKILANREKFFNRMLAKGNLDYNYINLTADERPLYAWNRAKAQMNPEEKQMTIDQWKNYVDEKQEAQGLATASSTMASQKITRSFSVDGMGVWNCDQIKRLNNPVQVMASYTNEQGEPINAISTFIIDKRLNGILQYYNTNQIAFSKTSETVLVAIKGNGEIAVATSECFKGKHFSDNGNYTFALKELSAGTNSVIELKKILGMQDGF